MVKSETKGRIPTSLSMVAGRNLNIQIFKSGDTSILNVRTYQSTPTAAMAHLLWTQQRHFVSGSSFPLSNDSKCVTNPCCDIGLVVVVLLGVVSACSQPHRNNLKMTASYSYKFLSDCVCLVLI